MPVVLKMPQAQNRILAGAWCVWWRGSAGGGSTGCRAKAAAGAGLAADPRVCHKALTHAVARIRRTEFHELVSPRFGAAYRALSWLNGADPVSVGVMPSARSRTG